MSVSVGTSYQALSDAVDSQYFIRKWHGATLKERSAAQEHFIDLCRLLREPTPAEADPQGMWYAFEKGAKKTGGGDGWADVWKKGCFAWEYKGKNKDLNAALRQLQQYALALENPPLLIVSDLETIVIHTNFTNTVHEVRTLPLDTLADTQQRQLLKWAFTEPERLKPHQTTAAVTKEAAQAFASLAQRLRGRGYDPQRVAHFITKLLFCLFAEDMGILKTSLFSELIATAKETPGEFASMAHDLFSAMQKGGRFGYFHIPWFNGGLFNDAEVIPLEAEDISIVQMAAQLDWSAIEPAIFGTLFERGLDPDKRSQLGAHYTDQGSIRRIINPVIRQPLLNEWETVKVTLQAHLDKAKAAQAPSTRAKAWQQAETAFQSYLEKLKTFRVLDPACGSGNFLYMALQTLKDLEHQVNLEAEQLGLQRHLPQVGPEAVLGIEINPYAAELARVTVWIGEIQWMLEHGYSLNMHPVLRPLNQIECRDALLNPDGSETKWPEVNVIVGNPPFLGDKKMLSELGEEHTAVLRCTYNGRVPGGADLVCYWFEKARTQLEYGDAQQVGLVATNSIRGGANRKVLDRVRKTGTIFNAWSDEPWINEGAAVRVSLVCFEANHHNEPMYLNGQAVEVINSDLTTGSAGGGSIDLTQAQPLSENAGVSFIGTQKNGPFDIPGDLARQWLQLPNPHGHPNSDVLRPWANGRDITRRPSDTWIIDFGVNTPEKHAALYEVPFEHILQHVRSLRVNKREERANDKWWLMQRPRPEMRSMLANLPRFIATSMVAKHRFFVWLPKIQIPENLVVAIARSDDTTFGILHSRFHELWALRLGTSLEDRPRYTPTTTFETFPFPEGLTPNILASDYAADPRAQAIAKAARHLNELRENWLNPQEWVKRVPEVVPGYPDRLIPVDEKAAQELKKRTLTNLYNQCPAWLDNAHRTLDEAVAAAYGWPVTLSNDEVLRRLLVLNLERTGSAQVNP